MAAAPTTAAVAPPTLFEEELLQSLKKKKIQRITTVNKVMEDLLKAVINTQTNVTETLDIIPLCPTFCLDRSYVQLIKIKTFQFFRFGSGSVLD